MPTNPPTGMPRILARVCYADIASAIEFLSGAFGFEEREEARVPNEDGSIALTEMQVVDSVIMLGSPGGHGMDTPRNLGGINQYLVVYVDDIDRHFQTAQRAGAEIVEEIADQFWGDRRYEALDLDGHRWAFHEHVRDVSPQEMAKAIAELSG